MLRTLKIASISVLFGMFVSFDNAQAANFEVLHAFKAGTDGSDPMGALIADGAGNLYGTTAHGGPAEAGTVFKLMPPMIFGGKWTKRVLHNFRGMRGDMPPDGSQPYAGLIIDKAGNLYGTTLGGGKFNVGTVFRVAADGTETLLYSFKGWRNGDGEMPFAGLAADTAGNLYGTTFAGGASGTICDCGIVFKLAPNGTYTLLHSFADGSDGSWPTAGLLIDTAGNLYGTTSQGGSTSNCDGGPVGCGTVFKISADGTESILYAFCVNEPCTDGAYPEAALIEDKAGNLYGTTSESAEPDGGTVFKLAPDGTETTLYSFGSKPYYSDGLGPYGGLVADKTGNLYGTTTSGGTKDGWGVVFKLAPDGTETVLQSFSGGRGGWNPHAGVIIENGKLFGETDYGGRIKVKDCYQGNGFGCGLIFTLDK